MDDSNIVINLIKDIHSISGRSIGELTKHFLFEKLPKETVFVKRSRRNEKEYLLLKGVCRSYVIDPQGKEVTLAFFLEKSPISPNISRTCNLISSVSIQALTDIEIASFSTTQLMQLMVANREIREWGNTVLQNELFKKVEKELSFSTMTAKERLMKFRERFHQLENLVPHPHIASYLGITNVSLSRLRREVMMEG